MKTLFFRVSVFSVLCFMTSLGARAAVPSVTTTDPTGITTNSATLNGTVHPNGLATAAYFEWGTTTNYGSVTALQLIGAGSGAVLLQANLGSLLTDTNYHYRLAASNSAGVSYGSDVIVTPTVLLYLYAGQSWTYAFHDLPLQGELPTQNPGFSRCNVGILPGSFAPGSGLRLELLGNAADAGGPAATITPASGFAGTGSFVPLWLNDLEGGIRLTMLTGSVVITSMFIEQIGNHHGAGSLAPHYRNTVTPTKFPQPALLGTQFVSSVTISSAVVTLDIDARNLSTGTFVQWGTTTNYGSASGATFVNFDYFVRRGITISNLAPGTTYHFRVVATNSAGVTTGNDLAVTTLAPATVVTLPASHRRATSATLNAAASINGLATTGYFEWGATTSYGQVTPLQNLGSATAVTNVSEPITGLNSEAAYNYRAVVFSAGLTNFGSNVVFMTTPPPTNLVVTNLATDDVRGALERGGSVTFACDGVLVLSNQIAIANDVSLDASGRAITFSGANTTRVFSVSPGITMAMTNITLGNGRSASSGGAIYNEGTVLAYGCRFISNMVIGAAGIPGTNGLAGTNNPNPALITPGTPGNPGSDGQDVLGGAIYNSGDLNLWRCLFVTNAALGGAGGAGGMGGRGGQSSISNPQYAQPGGAGGNGGAGGDAYGGAIASIGLVRIDGCTFSNSFSGNGTGGKAGAGGLQAYLVGGFYNGPSGTGGTGGLVLGGALYNMGPTYLSNSVFTGNSAFGGNGGDGAVPVYPAWLGQCGPSMGGAAYVSSNGILVNCTFVTNSVRGGSIGNGFGYVNGGNATGGALTGAGSLQVINSTFHGNRAIGGQGYSSPNGNSYGGSIANTGGVFQIVNSILSGGFSNNCFGAITDLGQNISSDATPAWTSGTSLNNTDPLLLPLANNGGPTLTMALRAGSPALNTADCALAPATDQRGYPRPSGPGCDIGAYEGPGTTSLQIIRQSSSTNVLRWLAEAGQVYRLEITTDFSGWTPYATNTAGASGFLDFPVPAILSPRFFRLLAQ